MKEYVVTFLFTPNFQKVWLIEKQKPEWQKGSLNGIGGKIENDELPVNAAIRELFEEAGIKVNLLLDVGFMAGTNNDNSSFKVHIFTGVTDEVLNTIEDEKIYLVSLLDVKKYKHIENIPMLIETCLYKINGHSNFSKLIMEY